MHLKKITKCTDQVTEETSEPTTSFQANAKTVPKIVAKLLLFQFIIHYHAFI
jgi:hypothetical protein